MSHSSPTPIVLLIGPLATGGQSALVRNILASDIGEHYPIALLNIGHAAMSTPKRLVLTARYLVELISILWRNPDIRLVHVHSSAGTALFEKGLFIFVAALLRRRILLHMHGGRFRERWSSFDPIRRGLTRLILSRCQGVIVLSDDWVTFYKNEVRHTGKIFSLPNSVSVCDMQKESEDDLVRILFVGHLKPEKGLFDLHRAMIGLPEPVLTRLRLMLMGTGDTPANELRIREAFSSMDSDRVQFLGFLTGEDKWNIFAKADILVLPSHSEDLPMAILEGMALGLPIIATRVGAVPTLVTDGREGRLTNPGDATGLAQSITELVGSSALRHAMGSAGRKRFETDFSFQRYISDLKRIYADIILDS